MVRNWGEVTGQVFVPGSPSGLHSGITWGFRNFSASIQASLVAQMVKKKKSAPNWGDLGSIPDEEDPLEKGMATHSSMHFAWGIPWIEEAGRLQSMGLQRVGQACATNTSGSIHGWRC